MKISLLNFLIFFIFLYNCSDYLDKRDEKINKDNRRQCLILVEIFSQTKFFKNNLEAIAFSENCKDYLNGKDGYNKYSRPNFEEGITK